MIGPVGYGIIFQFYNFLSLFTSSVHLGTPIGLIANKFESKNKFEHFNTKHENYFIYFIRLFVLISLSLSILFIYLSDYLSIFLVGEATNSAAFIIMIITAPIGVFFAFFDAYLKSREFLNQLVKITIISSLGSIIILYPLIKIWVINGAAIYFLISALFPIIIFGIYNTSFFKSIFKKRIRTHINEKIHILKIGSVSLVSSFMYLGSFILLRKFVIDNFGLLENGIFQAVITLANSSFLIVFSFLSSYLLPKLTKMDSYADIAKELDISFRFVIFMAIPILIFVYLTRTTIINFIFTSEFLMARELIFYQFLGECFKSFSALFGLWMISKMKIMHIISFDLIMNLILISVPFGVLYIFKEINLELLPISYMCALFIHFSLYLGYSIIHLKFKFSAQTIRTIFSSIIAILVCFFISYLDSLYQLISAPILIFLFLFTSFSIHERKRIYSIIQNNFKF